MALLLRGRGYNLRRGVHFRDGGTSACSHEGGTVAVPLACARVPRGVRPRTKPTEEGRASVLRGRLQSVDPTIERSSTRARPKSRLRAAPALAPPGAHTAGEPAAALLPVERESGRATRKKLRASGGQRTPSLVASLLPWVTTAPSYQSRKGGTDPWVQLQGTCSRSRGGGTINRGGTLNRTKMVLWFIFSINKLYLRQKSDSRGEFISQ